jgi:hypothetical protein
MISLIIALISGFMYVIGSLALILAVLVLPFLIKGGWILGILLIGVIICEIITGKDRDNENRN